MDVGALVGLTNSVNVVVQEAAVGTETVAMETVGRVTVGRETVGRETVGRVTVERVMVGRMEIGPPWGAAILGVLALRASKGR